MCANFQDEGQGPMFNDLFINASIYGPSVNMHSLIIGRVILSCVLSSQDYGTYSKSVENDKVHYKSSFFFEPF